MKNNYFGEFNEFNEIEDIISKNLENRGMDKIKLKGQLESCVKTLDSSNTVVIVTGFAVKAVKIGETDGPPGALALAYALESLNKKVIIVTDKYSEIFLRIGVKILNLDAVISIFEENKEEEQSEEIIRKYKPDHVIGIERPGRGCDNRCYSMRGEDITSFCPNTDLLFIKAKENNISTSAVGDGGNEVGMGKVKDSVIKYVNKGNIICAQFCSDNLIVAGVSNWGAFGICVGLCLLNNSMVMYDEEIYEKILKEIVRAGAVDGYSKKRETTVDGLTYEENLEIFTKLRALAETNIKSLVV